MNPFVCPARVMLATEPTDMRAGVASLAARVDAHLGGDAADGSLWCFVSRDARKAKLLVRGPEGWLLYYVRLDSGRIRWRAGASGGPALEAARADLVAALGSAPAVRR